MDSYEMRELAMFRKQMDETERLPLSERKANAVEWYKDLSENYMMVAERVGWLLNGSYGKGSFDSACRVLASPRMNQVAWCAITIANLEWRCPARFAIQAWKKMPVEKRYLANQAIRQAIEDAKREGYCGEIKKNPGGALEEFELIWDQMSNGDRLVLLMSNWPDSKYEQNLTYSYAQKKFRKLPRNMQMMIVKWIKGGLRG